MRVPELGSYLDLAAESFVIHADGPAAFARRD